MHTKILTAMSGGVDSGVSAYLMREKYKNCSGATMLLFLNEALNIPGRYPCCTFENIQDAKKICEILNIDHEVLNFMSEFEEHVIKNFVQVYEAGATPNPCITCNKYIKFDLFLNYALKNGFNKIATGHYAKIEFNNNRYFLKKAEDISRDQSYVLYCLTQEQLSHVDFPLGDRKKSEVRILASNLNLPVAKKHDSQDICFVPDGNYSGFIKSYTGKNYSPGEFVNTSGKILGVHKGIINYTIGQRRGLGVSSSSRLYISEIDPASNKIILAHDNDPDLYCKYIEVININLIAVDNIKNKINARVKIRYNQKELPAVIFQTESDKLLIEFPEPVMTPARGQSAVIYNGEYVIGGGIISRAFNSLNKKI